MLDFLVFGLLAALGWGIGDFLNARSSRKSTPENALVWTFGLLAVFWLVFGLLGGHFGMLSPFQLALALATGLFFSVGDFLFVSAAKEGKIVVASPLLALGAVIAMVLGVGVLGERPGWLPLGFVFLAVCGGVLVGLKDVRLRRLEDAVLWMVPAIVSHGVALTLAKVLVGELGALPGTAWFEALMLAYLVPFAWIHRARMVGPVVENAAAAGAYFVGFFAFATALSGGLVSLVAPIANLFPLVAVTLAVLVYGEKLQRHQWAGLALAALALAGLAG